MVPGVHRLNLLIGASGGASTLVLDAEEKFFSNSYETIDQVWVPLTAIPARWSVSPSASHG